LSAFLFQNCASYWNPFASFGTRDLALGFEKFDEARVGVPLALRNTLPKINDESLENVLTLQQRQPSLTT